MQDSQAVADTTAHAVLRTTGGHVTVVRAVAGVPRRHMAGSSRTICGLGGSPRAELACPRCRVGLIRLLGHLLRATGEDAVVQVDGHSHPARVVRALGLPLLARAVTVPDLPADTNPGLGWMTMQIPGSRQTHVALRTAAVHDPTWDRWWVARAVNPRLTACLRLGRSSDTADPHPDVLCAACAASRDRTADLLRDWAVPNGPPEQLATITILSPGADLARLQAKRAHLLVVARLSVTTGGHARLHTVMRADATMQTAWPVGRLASAFPGRPTMCGDEPDTPTAMLTTHGGCRRCAGAIGRLASALTRQWPLTRPAIIVGAPGSEGMAATDPDTACAVVPAVVLGGTRSRLGDPLLLAHIRRGRQGEAFADRIEVTWSASDTRLHLGWTQRVESEPGFAWWSAALPTPAITLCDLPVSLDRPAAYSHANPGATDGGAPCETCISRAIHPSARYGRYGADPDAVRTIAGRTYDRSLVDLLGEDFVGLMISTHLLEAQ